MSESLHEDQGRGFERVGQQPRQPYRPGGAGQCCIDVRLDRQTEPGDNDDDDRYHTREAVIFPERLGFALATLTPFVLSLSKHVPGRTPFDKLRANGRIRSRQYWRRQWSLTADNGV